MSRYSSNKEVWGGAGIDKEENAKQCDDVYRIFPMVVQQVVEHGSIRWVKEKEPTVWNIYATSYYTDMYKSFYDIGKTVFLTQAEAEKHLRELEEKG